MFYATFATVVYATCTGSEKWLARCCMATKSSSASSTRRAAPRALISVVYLCGGRGGRQAQEQQGRPQRPVRSAPREEKGGGVEKRPRLP